MVTALALALALWAYYGSTSAYLPCPDGHCPDPGTREYLNAVAVRAERAPTISIIVFAAVLSLGGLGFGLFALLRKALARK